MKFTVKIFPILFLYAMCAAGGSAAQQAGGGAAMSLQPQTPADLCRSAEKAKKAKDYERAADLYTQALAMDPAGTCGGAKPGRAQCGRGDTYLLLGRPEEALSDLDKAGELDPLNPDVYAYRGFARVRQKKMKEAEEEFDKALGIDPRNVLARAGRQMVSALTQMANILQKMNRAARTGQGAPAVLAPAGSASQQQDCYGLKDQFERGKACYAAGKYSAAIDNLKKALGADPGREAEIKQYLIKAYGARSSASFQAGGYDQCIADLDEILKLEPGLDDVRKTRDFIVQTHGVGSAGQPSVQPASNLLAAPAALLQQQQAAQSAYGGGSYSGSGYTGPNSAPGVPLPAADQPAGRSFGDQMGSMQDAVDKAEAAVKFASLMVTLAMVLVALFAVMLIIMRRNPDGKGYVLRPGVRAACDNWLGLLKLCFSAPSAGPSGAGASTGGIAALVRDGNYEEARAALVRKAPLDIADYDLFLEIYVKQGDFMRARLTADKVEQRFTDQPGRQRDHKLYLALTDRCRDAGQDDLARRLRRIAAGGMLKSVSVKLAPALFYDIAAALEKDGDNKLAADLYRELMAGGRPYRDSAQRFAQIKDLPDTRTGFPASWSAPAARPAGPVSEPALVLDRYEVKRMIGEGEMGVVYEAWDRQRGRKVALKKMRSWLKNYPEERERFLREAGIVQRLKHPNIVGVQAIAEKDGDIYMVFDFIDGRPLSESIRGINRVPLSKCKEIFRGVCEAVHYAHVNNIIHRDLKPDNILLDAQGRAFVTDFGLASELRDGLTRVSHQTMSGTPAYMAPEQHKGVVKKESDIYALGVCLYETLAGKRPFSGGDFHKQKCERDYRDITSALPWLPAGIDGVIGRALAPEPAARFADALEFYEALKKL